MSTLNQQTLADSGATERPPMLERRNYIPWESRFKRFLDNKLEDRELSINIMFLNSLQPEWRKYVTMVRYNQTGDIDSYDVLYDSLIQFEPHVLTSKAKKAAKRHDPLSILAFSNASSSQCHANSSYSPQPYYVTHPSSVVNYEDEYQGELQGDSQEDNLTTFMMLLARAITQKFSIPTNNRLRTSSNTRNKVVIQDGRVEIQTKNVVYGGNGNKNAGRQNRNQAFNAGTGNDERNQIKPRVHDAKYFRKQILLAMKDEAGSNLNNEENDFMLDTSYGEETIEELTAAAVSDVNASSKVHEQVRHVKRKTIIQTSADYQIDFYIMFDDPFVEHNGGTSDHDSNAHDEYHEIQMLAYNVQKEAKNQRRSNNELKKQKMLLQKGLETCKDRVKMFESKTIQCSKYKETCEELEHELRDDKNTIEIILKEKDNIQNDFFKIKNEKIIIQHETQLAKKAFKEHENRYLEDICDLEEKLSSHDRIVYKIVQSLQIIHMLGKTPNKVYDPFLKAGLGYKNLDRLKKAIAA
uniref:Gag-Pol polyprotein n=1 Tax=Tanacetum cinerariifolium TaxID=118510 RepID=A0A6L2J5A9_TANCI|nr:hypothetical protein [Tanacetum cinerariifolium]